MRPFTYWKRHVPIAAVIVVTIALGIGGATAVYAVVEAVILRALPVRDPQRLVWMWNARVERDRAPFSALDLADYRNDNTVLERLAPFTNWTANLTGIGDATLGARPRQILVTLLVVEWRPIALGLALGALGGVIAAPVLGSELFATSGVEPLVIGPAAVILGVAALIASYLPARRAIRTDPVAALRAQ